MTAFSKATKSTTAERFSALDSCAYCGAKSKLQFDHVLAKAKGGEGTTGNCLPACHRCNNAKRDKPIQQFLEDEAKARLQEYTRLLTAASIANEGLGEDFDRQIFNEARKHKEAVKAEKLPPAPKSLATPDELKSARATLGLSAQDMALALGLGHKARIYEYECGARKPSGPALILYRVYLLKPKTARDVIEGRI